MAASYPAVVFAPGTKSSGQIIQASHVNDLDAEVVAIENALTVTGLAHHLKFVDGTYDIGASGSGRPRDVWATRRVAVGSTTHAALPTAAVAGALMRQSDGARGIWMDSGAQWLALNGQTANVKEFGAVGDGVTNDTSAYSDAFAAAYDVFVPPGTYKVNAFSIPQGKRLILPPGAIMAVVAGQTITVHGIWHAGHYQTISSTDISTATPPVLFSSVGVGQDYISAAWWGAVGDCSTGIDGTDNSTPLQQFFIQATNIATLHARNGVKAVIPPGRYRFGSRLFIMPTQSGTLGSPGVQTQAAFGFTIEGAVGSKVDVGDSIMTTALMHTQLVYTGASTQADEVGIQVGENSTVYAAVGGVFRHIWFATPPDAQVRAIVRGFMTSGKFEDCIFSGAGVGTSTRSGGEIDCGLKLSGFGNTVRDCSFQDTFGGLWFDQGNSCTVERTTFKATRSNAVVVSGGSMVVRENVFQDITGAAVAADASLVPGIIGGLTICNNYFETNGAGSGGYIEINGAASTNPAKSVSVRENYFNAVGTAAPAFLRFANTDGMFIGPNFWPAVPPSGALNQELVEAVAGQSNVNVTIYQEGRVIPLSTATNSTFTDLQMCAYIFSNGDSTSALSPRLPRGVPGLPARFYKSSTAAMTILPNSTGLIDGNPNISNGTDTDAGKAFLTLRCVAENRWVTESKSGTWV